MRQDAARDGAGRREGGSCRSRPVVGVARRSWLVVAALAAAAGAVVIVLSDTPALASETLAEIGSIPQQGLYRRDFSLASDADVTVEAIGCGLREPAALIAYAWILDLKTRHMVWQMEASRAEETRQKYNLRQEETLHLAAGDYALYFAAYGGSFPIEKTIRLLKLFKLGNVSIFGGNRVRWNEYGDPDRWHAIVRLEGTDRSAVGTPPAGSVDLGALLRFDRTGDSAYRAARLDLSAPLTLRILAIGEYAASDHDFADAGWIADLQTCGRVWQMTLVNTEPAGGAGKNRLFDGEVTLGPGRYLVSYGTDDSHAYGAWNSNPPFDPDSWGITLIPVTTVAPGAARITLNPPDENVIARIDRVGDDELRCESFRLSHAAEVCIRALGEWDRSDDRFLDYGWIEDAYSLNAVWTMEFNEGRYAGGEARNRLVEDRVRLEPGTYRVCYVTDEAHSFSGWHDHPPIDPEAWGIRLQGVGAGFSADWVSPLQPGEEDRSVVSLAPMRSGVHKTVRFEVREPLAVRVIALGEASDHELADYGWIEREDTGEVIWMMEYADTHPAGGARKNRREDRLLHLQPARYVVHYLTDDSHAFGDWNAAPPSDPHLWGITVIELREGE